MQQLKSILTRFEGLLDEESAAIRDVETDLLLRIAAEKETLMVELVAGDVGAHPPLVPRFARLTERLRRNLVLLVHAKICLQEVLESASGRTSTYQPSGRSGAATKGSQVSVTG